MKKLLITFVIPAALVPCFILAQNLESLGGQSNNLLVSTVPPRPAPNQSVTVTVESYAIDLDRADISWFLDNKLQVEQIGQKTFTFTTGKTGSLSNILIIVKTQNGAIIQQTLNIRPASVDILWEAQSYTPPFYQGKALYPPEGTVKVVAMPNFVGANGAVINPSTLIYTWKLDGNPIAAASGYGKNYILYTGSIPLKAAAISVEATSLDQTYSAEGSVYLSPSSPKIVYYEDNPLLGILFNKALGNTTRLQNQELTVAAIPYFMGATTRDGGGLAYEWDMNNEKIISSGSDTSTLAFRQQSAGQGTAALSLQVSNPSHIFQFVRSNMTLMFGTASGAQSFTGGN